LLIPLYYLSGSEGVRTLNGFTRTAFPRRLLANSGHFRIPALDARRVRTADDRLMKTVLYLAELHHQIPTPVRAGHQQTERKQIAVYHLGLAPIYHCIWCRTGFHRKCRELVPKCYIHHTCIRISHALASREQNPGNIWSFYTTTRLLSGSGEVRTLNGLTRTGVQSRSLSNSDHFQNHRVFTFLVAPKTWRTFGPSNLASAFILFSASTVVYRVFPSLASHFTSYIISHPTSNRTTDHKALP
jgi:hypothetical protein